MVLKNIDILSLGKKGIAGLDYTVLDASSSYKVYKIVRALETAVKSIQETRADIVHKILGDKFEACVAYEQAKDKSSEGIIAEGEYRRFMNELQPLLTAHLEDVSDLGNLSTIGWDEYFALKQANKDILDATADRLLEGILWIDN